MKEIIEKQILQWKEELAKQVQTKNVPTEPKIPMTMTNFEWNGAKSVHTCVHFDNKQNGRSPCGT